MKKGWEFIVYTGPESISEAEAYYRVGRMYYDGLGVEKNEIKGCKYFEIAFDKGARNIRVGDYLMMGVYRHLETQRAVKLGLTRNLKLAIKWYECSLEKCIWLDDEEGINKMLSHIGRACVDDEIRDYKRAFVCLKCACEQEAEALFYLARMYDRGLYVDENREKAVYLLYQILITPRFEDEVFYDCAQEILDCWERGASDEVVDEIVNKLG